MTASTFYAFDYQGISIPAFKQVLVATAPAGTQIRFPDIVKLHDGRLFTVYHVGFVNGLFR